jgi:hypothetical protein
VVVTSKPDSGNETTPTTTEPTTGAVDPTTAAGTTPAAATDAAATNQSGSDNGTEAVVKILKRAAERTIPMPKAQVEAILGDDVAKVAFGDAAVESTAKSASGRRRLQGSAYQIYTSTSGIKFQATSCDNSGDGIAVNYEMSVEASNQGAADALETVDKTLNSPEAKQKFAEALNESLTSGTAAAAITAAFAASEIPEGERGIQINATLIVDDIDEDVTETVTGGSSTAGPAKGGSSSSDDSGAATPGLVVATLLSMLTLVLGA